MLRNIFGEAPKQIRVPGTAILSCDIGVALDIVVWVELDRIQIFGGASCGRGGEEVESTSRISLYNKCGAFPGRGISRKR